MKEFIETHYEHPDFGRVFEIRLTDTDIGFDYEVSSLLEGMTFRIKKRFKKEAKFDLEKKYKEFTEAIE